MIKEELNNLKKEDIYSLILFALYQLHQIPEYSALCELSYTLDRNSLLNLFNYFGGCTIKIPTIKQLQQMLDVLFVYQKVELEKMEFVDALNEVTNDENEQKSIKEAYDILSDSISNFSFRRDDDA